MSRTSHAGWPTSPTAPLAPRAPRDPDAITRAVDELLGSYGWIAAVDDEQADL